MKIKHFVLFSLLIVAAGCSPSTNANLGSSFTNTGAAHIGNVSGIYGLANYGTVGSWTGVDIKWKDSSGTIRALSGYAGKTVLLSFWAVAPPNAASEESTLDSVQSTLGDSVGIVTIDEDNFQAVYNYDTLNKIRVQIVVDSAKLANIQYAELADSQIGWPETFILRPNGTIMAYAEEFEPQSTLDSLVRAAYP